MYIVSETIYKIVGTLFQTVIEIVFGTVEPVLEIVSIVLDFGLFKILLVNVFTV